MLIDFQNTFKDRLSGKFATEIIFKYPTTPNIQLLCYRQINVSLLSTNIELL